MSLWLRPLSAETAFNRLPNGDSRMRRPTRFTLACSTIKKQIKLWVFLITNKDFEWIFFVYLFIHYLIKNSVSANLLSGQYEIHHHHFTGFFLNAE